MYLCVFLCVCVCVVAGSQSPSTARTSLGKPARTSLGKPGLQSLSRGQAAALRFAGQPRPCVWSCQPPPCAPFVLNKRWSRLESSLIHPGALERGLVNRCLWAAGGGVRLLSRGAHPEPASSKETARAQPAGARVRAAWSEAGRGIPSVPWMVCRPFAGPPFSPLVSCSRSQYVCQRSPSSILSSSPKNCSCTRQLQGFPSPRRRSEAGKTREGLYLEPDLSSGHGAVF